MCSINGNNKLKLLFIADEKTVGSRRRWKEKHFYFTVFNKVVGWLVFQLTGRRLQEQQDVYIGAYTHVDDIIQICITTFELL